jgi:hypothetical protein
MPIIPVLWRLRQEGHELEANLSYVGRTCLKKISQAWWCTVIIPALGRLRQEDQEFENIVKLCLKNKNNLDLSLC